MHSCSLPRSTSYMLLSSWLLRLERFPLSLLGPRLTFTSSRNTCLSAENDNHSRDFNNVRLSGPSSARKLMTGIGLLNTTFKQNTMNVLSTKKKMMIVCRCFGTIKLKL